jgi:hypothetical protein
MLDSPCLLIPQMGNAGAAGTGRAWWRTLIQAGRSGTTAGSDEAPVPELADVAAASAYLS